MKRLFVAALKEETPGLNFFNYTGAGKINAAYHITKLIIKYKPLEVINFGSAGSLKKKFEWANRMHKVLSKRHGC